MREIAFEILDWLGGSVGDPPDRETLASLRIRAGPRGIPVTEVEDTIAQTVRRHINVSVHSLARWLVVNWWRLRWEPPRQSPTFDWLRSHSLAAIGGDYAWPALTIASDGEFIQLRLQAEPSPDVSAIRYLRDIALDVPATEFEQAVDEFLDQVEARLRLRAADERELMELREELRQERSDRSLSMTCKLEALSGFDPGSTSDDWRRAVETLATSAGAGATEEILAVVPTLPGGLTAAAEVISAMRSSVTTVKLEWATLRESQARVGEIPWECGTRMANELRIQIGLSPGPVTSDTLAQLLDVKLPLSKTWTGPRQLRGGFRNGVTHGRTAVLVTSPLPENQRFYLARLVGAALRASDTQYVLPVSNAATALQKFERSFAQEFLCPWQDLDAFTDHVGTDDDGITDAAAHFAVSEKLVLTTLVNKGKLPRSRLDLS